jgi:tyrosine-protein phosphatase non-receptor type 12/18/22
VYNILFYYQGASGSNAYIASQGPLPNTVNDFWRMVIECEVQVIVMACNEQEAGKYKCENYWNEDETEEKQFGKFFVKLLKSREICPDFLVRTMRLRWTADGGKGEEERTVCQFHYSAWPDHGVPTQVKPLLEMVRLIRDCQASETLPVLVKISANPIIVTSFVLVVMV